jgi:hypothetical protein
MNIYVYIYIYIYIGAAAAIAASTAPKELTYQQADFGFGV